VFDTFTLFKFADWNEVPVITTSVDDGPGINANAEDANKAKANTDSFFMINPLLKRSKI
jgi:hypothetical protein